MSSPTSTLATSHANLKKIESFAKEIEGKLSIVLKILDEDLTGKTVLTSAKIIESAVAPVAKGLIQDMHDTSTSAATTLESASKTLDSLISKVIPNSTAPQQAPQQIASINK